MKINNLFLTVFATGFIFSSYANATWQEGVIAFEDGNYGKAFEEFRPLENSPDAKYFLYYMGRMYQFGLGGVPKDITRAVNYYYKATQAGDSRGAVELGSIYFKGEDLPPDYPLAKQWFEYAFAQGNPVAAHNLGIIYENGVGGVNADIGRAFEYFLFSANKGYDEAQKKVGIMMFEGLGTPQDYSMGVKYLLKAANQGNTEAMMKLGEYLSDKTRIGAPINFVHAHKWYNIAAGYSVNPETRKSATAKRDALVKGMKPEEVLLAHESARNWKPKKTDLNTAPFSTDDLKPKAAPEVITATENQNVKSNDAGKESADDKKAYHLHDILNETEDSNVRPSSVPSL